MILNFNPVRRVSLFALALLAFLLMTSPALAQNQPEAPPSLNLVVLEDDQVVTGVFEDEINAQLYMFLGSTGDRVTISMTQSSDTLLDPYLVLLGAAGQVYAADDDSGVIPLSAQISDFTLPEDGLYFVLATSYTGLRRGVFTAEGEAALRPQVYELVVSGITTPPSLQGADVFSYQAGEMRLGDTQRVEISPEEPVFYVNFFGQAGQRITITTRDDGDGPEVDTLLYLFDRRGLRVAINDDTNNLYAVLQNITLEQTGLYLIFATGYQYESAYAGNWRGAGSFLLAIEGN